MIQAQILPNHPLENSSHRMRVRVGAMILHRNPVPIMIEFGWLNSVPEPESIIHRNPIALIHQELAFSDLTRATMRSEDLAGSPPRICIRRITTRVDPPPKKKPKTGPGKEPNEPAKRTCEYVAPLPRAAGHPPAVHWQGGLAAAFQALHVHTAGAHRPYGHRHYPQKAPGVRQDALQPPARRSARPLGHPHAVLPPGDGPARCRLHGRPACGRRLRLQVLGPRQGLAVPPARPARPARLQALRPRDSLPDVPRVQYTVRNVNWLIRYWRDLALVPDPLAYERAAQGRRRVFPLNKMDFAHRFCDRSTETSEAESW